MDGVKGDQVAIADQIDSLGCAGESVDGCAAETCDRSRRKGRQPADARDRPEFDAENNRNRLGFIFGAEPLNPGPVEAAGVAEDFMWLVTSRTVTTLSQIYQAERREELSGVAGSYEVTRQAIDIGTRQALTLVALISLSLGIINLFPFLPLDGGHIFWSIVEKIRGKPVPFAVMERAGLIGFALVIGLFLIGLNNDIGRFMGDGFDLR